MACLFDKSGLPPKALLTLIKEKCPKELNAFINDWIYCITIGRGAKIIARYMRTIAYSYLKRITKKQLKALKEDKNIIFEAIKRGIDEISLQFERLLKHLRAHSEVLINIREVSYPSINLRIVLNAWHEISSREITNLLELDEKQDIPLPQVKRYYDKILNIGICGCLLGLPPVEENNKKRRVSAFDRFSAYLEFLKEQLTEKFTRSDIEALYDKKRNTPNSISVFTLKKDEHRGKYSTLDFLNDLETEINKLKLFLAQALPYRFKLPDSKLSLLWSFARTWITNQRSGYSKSLKNKKSSLLPKLENIIKTKLDTSATRSLKIIKQFKNDNFTLDEFIDRLEVELGKFFRFDKIERKTGIITKGKIPQVLLSLILFGNENYLSEIKRILTTSNTKKYSPDFKLSKEHLGTIKTNLKQLLGKNSLNSLSLIQKYKNSNLDIKDYQREQTTIKNKNYFKDLSTPERLSLEVIYWYGFLNADGSISTKKYVEKENNYRISLRLSLKDKERVHRFAEVVGLDKKRVKPYTQFRMYKGKLREYQMIGARFQSKTMWEHIMEQGFTSSQSKEKRIPRFVQKLVSMAKEEFKEMKIHWWYTNSGKKALTWLLGFYDGDGTLDVRHGIKADSRWYSASLRSGNKEFLFKIKKLFEIKRKLSEEGPLTHV